MKKREGGREEGRKERGREGWREGRRKEGQKQEAAAAKKSPFYSLVEGKNNVITTYFNV